MMTTEWFDGLTKRDFENGAVLSEIRKTIRQQHELLEAVIYTESLLAKIPAFGDSIGSEVSKAQLGVAHNKLRNALSISGNPVLSRQPFTINADPQ